MLVQRNATRTLAGLLTCLIIGGSFQFSSVHAADGSGKRIGVVSVSQVFKAYKKVIDIQKKLELKFDAAKKAIEADSNHLRDWSRQIKQMTEKDMMQKGNFVKYQQFRMAEFDLKKRLSKLAQDVEVERMAEMKQVLREIRGSITAVAKQQNYDMVMRAPEYDDKGAAVGQEAGADEPKTSAQLVRRFRENPVLFYSPSVDITKAVIQKLNNDYAAAK